MSSEHWGHSELWAYRPMGRIHQWSLWCGQLHHEVSDEDGNYRAGPTKNHQRARQCRGEKQSLAMTEIEGDCLDCWKTTGSLHVTKGRDTWSCWGVQLIMCQTNGSTLTGFIWLLNSPTPAEINMCGVTEDDLYNWIEPSQEVNQGADNVRDCNNQSYHGSRNHSFWFRIKMTT